MPNAKRSGLDEGFMAEVTFTTTASLHQDYGGENFLHEIFGKISIRNVDDHTEEQAGEMRAWLIQFLEAQAHGFSPRIVGDGYSLEISRYWQELFDLDEFRPEIQNDWQTEGSDLLIVGSMQILDRFEGQRIGLAALGRTIDLFSRSCDLVACFPESMQDSLNSIVECSEPMEPETERSDPRMAIAMLTKDLIAAGFRRLGKTGLYLLNPSHERPDVLLE
ncbi:MAG TPA: hypothetical protein VFW31_07285 [Candidatus Angelobacter sp.]|nr:hypothetical protein [Candidatus Angelobacter sp.]